MNRQEKNKVIDSLKGQFAGNPASFLIGVQGLTAEQTLALRKGVRQNGGTINVAKNTLLKLAVKDANTVADLAPYFKQQIAVVFAQDGLSIAKILCNFAKENEKLQVIAGLFEERVITANEVQAIASLPSKEVLIARICGSLKSPVARIARVCKHISEQQS